MLFLDILSYYFPAINIHVLCYGVMVKVLICCDLIVDKPREFFY